MTGLTSIEFPLLFGILVAALMAWTFVRPRGSFFD